MLGWQLAGHCTQKTSGGQQGLVKANATTNRTQRSRNRLTRGILCVVDKLQSVDGILPTFCGSVISTFTARATRNMQGVFSDMDCSEEDQSELLTTLIKLHASAAAQLGAAPRKFMAAADVYAGVITKKRSQLLQQQQFLKVR